MIQASLHGSDRGQILTISETWLHRDVDTGILMIPGYKIIRQDRGTIQNDGQCKQNWRRAEYLP